MILNKKTMTVLEAILLEMEEKGLDSANGINICELIDRHDIEVHEEVVGLVNSWREHNKNEKKDL